VNIGDLSPAQALRMPFILRHPLAGCAAGNNASTDTKKARFAATSLGQPGNNARLNRHITYCWSRSVYDIAMHHRGTGDRIPSNRANSL
jgi:hypothetical protein